MDISQEIDVKKEADFNGLLDSLLSVIKKEVEVYKELQFIITKEFDVLMQPTLDLLSYSNTKKDTCILKARMLEEVRSNIVKKIARFLGREEKEINFTVLSSYGDKSRTAELDTQRKILFPLIQGINEANEKNKGLLDFSLSYVRSSMDFVNNLLSTGADYGGMGRLKSGGLHGRVINREG